MNLLTVGAGTMPDVTETPTGWVYAWQPLAEPRVIVIEAKGRRELPVGPGQLAFVRLGYFTGLGLLVGWRGLNNYAYLLRTGVSADPIDFGPSGGNNPVAIDNTVFAWQTLDHTERCYVNLAELPADPRWLPTGLATAEPLTYIDDVRASVPGMYNPVRAGDLTVGEALDRGGVLCRLDDTRELRLWDGEDTVTPRCAMSGDGARFAVCCWGKEDVRFAFNVVRAQFTFPRGEPPVITPPPIEPPIVVEPPDPKPEPEPEPEPEPMPIPPYDEHWIVSVASPIFWQLYQQAGRVFGDDPEGMVWIARTQYDIDAGMDPDAALARHAAECKAALGLGG